MNKRFIIMVCIALVLAFMAAMVAKGWLKSQVVVADGVETKNVIVAAREIPFGIKLELTHLKSIALTIDSAPEETFEQTDNVIGKITKIKFYPGDIITKFRITEHLGGSTLSALINQNYRAVSVRVNDIVGVAGFILPGNRVDVLATKNTGASRRNVEIHTILENINVLAVDQEASPDKEKPAIVRAVTLELLPKQAEKLVKAMQEGKIQLTLRNPLDNEEIVIAQHIPAPDRHKKKAKPYSPPVMTVIPWHSSKGKKCSGSIC